MIQTCYDPKSVFECVCNDERGTDAIKRQNLSEEEWNNLIQIANFLKVPAEITIVSSSSANSTLSIQYRIFNILIKHCTDTLASTTALRVVKNAEARMKRSTSRI